MKQMRRVWVFWLALASPGGLKAYWCGRCQPLPLTTPRGVLSTKQGLRFSGVARIQGKVAAFPYVGPSCFPTGRAPLQVAFQMVP